MNILKKPQILVVFCIVLVLGILYYLYIPKPQVEVFGKGLADRCQCLGKSYYKNPEKDAYHQYPEMNRERMCRGIVYACKHYGV